MINAIVIGASGYSGAEAVDLLLRHLHARVAALFGSDKRSSGAASPRFASLFPRFAGRCDLPVEAFDLASALALKPDAAFLATPHETSHEIAPALVSAGVRVFDLSAAFRLKDTDVFEKTYGFKHAHLGLLERAAYGIPEINRERIASADLVACAGCYATAAILPLKPLADAGAIDPEHAPIVDAVSGVSGAGRSPSQTVHFCEVSLQPYNALRHRHAPEMAQQIGVVPDFVPHLGCFDRGILATIHVMLAPGCTADSCREILTRAYASAPFVRILPEGSFPSVAAVKRSNFCHIGIVANDARRRVTLFSAIDNLVKGAAGQAVQCMNIRFGLPETAGLL